MGPWPGTDGLPPLVIPGNKFGVRFETDRDVGGWGYRIEARADVDQPACQELLAALSGESLAVKYREVEEAVAAAMRSEACAGLGLAAVKAEAARALRESSPRRAVQDLKTTQAKKKSLREVREEEEDDEGTGFYRKGKGDAQVQVNVQSGEVLLAGRMLVPVRADVADEAAYRDVFGGSVERREGTDYCAELARRENCRKLAVMRPDGQTEDGTETKLIIRNTEGFRRKLSIVSGHDVKLVKDDMVHL